MRYFANAHTHEHIHMKTQTRTILSVFAFLLWAVTNKRWTCSLTSDILSVHPSEVSPVRPGLYGVECEAAGHLLARRVFMGCSKLRPLPACWRRTRCQVPGGGAAPAGLRTDLWERRALPRGMTDTDKHKTSTFCTERWRIRNMRHIN